MKTHRNFGAAGLQRTLVVFITFSALAGARATAQTNGTWNANAPGNWSDAGNWLGGNVASGATFIADFSTVNITGNHLVTIDAPYTIGTLLSQDATTSSNSWVFDGTGPLTLDNGGSQPVLNIINRSPVISAPLAGTNGFSKTGAGQLTLSGNNAGLGGTIDLADVGGTNAAGLVLASNTAIGGVTTVNINGTGTTSGQFLALTGGVTVGNGVTLNLASQGGNNAPSGGLRSEGASTDVNTIQGPLNLLQTNVRIANNTAGRLDITGPITAGGGVTQFFFRFGKNEGIHITNSSNSWSGTTVHSQETLWFEPNALPTTTNLSMCSSGAGTVQTNGSFTRALGSAANEARFALSAARAQGFGARGGPLSLNFGGGGADVFFDTSGTAPDTRIRTNILVLNNDTADSNLTLVNPLDLNGGDRTIQVDAMTSTLQGGLKGGAFGITKTGAGTLDLSGPCTQTGGITVNAGILNASGALAYGGGTTVAGGTLQTSGGNDRLPTTTTLAFTGTSGALDLTTSQTLANLTVPNLLAATYTISGTSLTLDGAFDRQFGPGGAVTNAHSIAMDLSVLSSFTSTAPANVFRVGMKAGGLTNSGSLGDVATVVLADQNEITASTLAIGDQGASNHGGTSTLRLGRVNTLNVNAINSGYSGRSNTNLLFDPGLTNPSVTIRNTDGSSAVANWLVGRAITFSASTWTDSVDLSEGTVDALVNALTVGSADSASATGRAGIENASFTMGAGTLDASTLLLGRIAGSGASTVTNPMEGNGTFTLGHASGTLKADTLTLAENTTLAGGAGARSVSGTFNLIAGTLEATTIQLGAQTGNATATADFNWTDGTVRSLTASGLAFDTVPISLLAGSHILDTTVADITVNSTSSISGDGGLTKIGTGTVSLQGTNTYTGPTDVQAGTLAISNSFPSGSAITVDASATLDLANVTLTGLPALDIDGSLNLSGPVKIVLPAASTVPGNFLNLLQYGGITGAGNLTTDYRNASFTPGATATDLTVSAGIPLVWTGSSSGDWDVNTSVNWKDGSDNPETFFWADSVTFDSAGSSVPSVNLASEMRPAAITVNEASVDYDFSGPGFISGASGLSKSGAAKLTINTDNTNTGITTVNAGTLQIGSGGTTGWMGSGDIVNDGSLVFNRSDNFTVANAISGAGSVTKLGDGVMRFITDNGYAGGTTISAGALHVGTQSITGSPGTGAIVNDGILRFNRADGSSPYAYTVANDISGTGDLYVGQSTSGSLDSVVTLTGTNSFTGNITIYSGGLNILNVAALGTGPKTINANNGSNGKSQFYLDGTGGNITVPADIVFRTSSDQLGRPAIGNLAGDNVIEGSVTLTSGGGNTAISVIGGSLTLNGAIVMTTTARNLNLGGGTIGANGTINGAISNGANALGVIKSGANTWTLTSNSSDYTGVTNVNGGTLLVNGTQNLATGNVTVASGATLGGTGTIGGNTTVSAGGILAPGASVGTFTTVNSVVLAGTLAIEINGASADRLDVGGTLDITSATVDFDELAAASGSPIIIASYGALAGTQFASVIDLPAGYTLDYNYNSLKQIALVSGGSDYDTWAGGFGLNPLTDGAPAFDKDNDGLTNSQEYAFGLDPTSGSSVSPITESLDKGTGTFKYTRRLESLTGLSYSYQSSATLGIGGWALFTPVSEASNGGSPVEEITVTVPAALLTGDKRFVRVLAD